MLFNSYIFIFLFLPFVLAGYYLLGQWKDSRPVLIFLIGMSFWFYGYNSLPYLLILAGSVLVNYFLMFCMKRFSCRKLFLILGLCFNIGILFYFKYYDFFAKNLNHVLPGDLPLLQLLLPLGISFYTFQQISFCIDAYRGECADYGFLEYAAYVTYFPQLIAGPIVYHNELIPQLRDSTKRKPNYENLGKGLYAFALGLAKKVLVADSLSKLVTCGYADLSSLNSVSAFLVMLCYSLQIYFDFSGYCDMALGIGCMMNIKLPVNFNSPYKAVSVSDFWDRWHMTLTRFFTKYVYIPLGGNRRGEGKTCRNILLVFLLSGLWHGADWTFILWGALHGAAMLAERMGRRIRKKIDTADSGSGEIQSVAGRLGACLSRACTFLFVTLAWSIFRAPSIRDALVLFQRLLFGGGGGIEPLLTERFRELIEINILCRLGFGGVADRFPLLLPGICILLLLSCCFFLRNTQEKCEKFKFSAGKGFVTVLLLFWSIMSLTDISEFLYFNF